MEGILDVALSNDAKVTNNLMNDGYLLEGESGSATLLLVSRSLTNSYLELVLPEVVSKK